MAIEQAPAQVVHWISRAAKSLLYRLYALFLLLVIVTLTWMAFSYLLGSLVDPVATPAAIADLPKRLDMATLGHGRADWAAMDSTLHTRSPLSHYHRLGGWVQTDLGNDCTSSGCHSPMPHFRRKEVRAFLNMHGTVMHCGVCHITAPTEGATFTWYDPQTGSPGDSPAVLAALDLVQKIKSDGLAPEQREALLGLLGQAKEQTQSHPEVVLLARHVEAARPGSDQWPQILEMSADALARHFRGEYGRKIALAGPGGLPLLGHPNTEVAKNRLRSLPPGVDSKERQDFITAAHPMRRNEPRNCSECHSSTAGFISYTQLGYPTSRAEDLTSQVIFEMVENIAGGTEFQMPRVLDRKP